MRLACTGTVSAVFDASAREIIWPGRGGETTILVAESKPGLVATSEYLPGLTGSIANPPAWSVVARATISPFIDRSTSFAAANGRPSESVIVPVSCWARTQDGDARTKTSAAAIATAGHAGLVIPPMNRPADNLAK